MTRTSIFYSIVKKKEGWIFLIMKGKRILEKSHFFYKDEKEACLGANESIRFRWS
jgi:hypothetical protein